MTDSWDGFFDPRLVCVVGASGDPSRIGGRLVRYSLAAGFAGRVVPINPRRSEVFGLPTLPRLTDLDEVPDLVVIAVPRDGVLPALRDAVQAKARNVCVVTAGFAEKDEQGAELQRQLVEISRAGGVRLLGPNCNGLMNPVTGAFFAFTGVVDSARPEPGSVAVVTQSAAVGTYLVNSFSRKGLGLSNWIHTGNEAGVTALEATRALAGRDCVRAVALHFEAIRDLADLHDTAALLARSGTALTVLQGGRSPVGRLAGQAHTAAIIGDEADLLGDLLSSAGAYVAPSVSTMTDFLQMAVNHRSLPPEPRLGFVTTSGGVGILMADAAHASSVEMPTLSAALQSRITGHAAFVHPANPVDTTAQVVNDPEAFRKVLVECADADELDLVSVFVAHGLAGPQDPTLQAVLDTAADRPSRPLAALGVFAPESARALQSAGVSTFGEPVDLANALRAAGEASRRQAAFAGRDRDRDQPAAGSPSPFDGGRLLDEVRSKARLRESGVPVVEGDLVLDADEARRAFARFGAPVVAKLVSPALAHKADAGGVRLALADEAAVVRACDDLRALSATLGLAEFDILVEPQLTGREIFVSVVRHPQLGTLVGLGRGGSGVEADGGVRWFWDAVEAGDVDASLGVGAAPAELLAEFARGLTRLGPDVVTVETNPVILDPVRGAVAVDALMEVG